MTVTQAMEQLIGFAKTNGLLDAADTDFARNSLLHAMRMTAPEPCEFTQSIALPPTPTPILAVLEAAAVEAGIIEDDSFSREQFSAHLMNLLTPAPSVVQARYLALRESEGPEAATDWFYALCRASDYIRVDEIARNIVFTAPSKYGDLEITINLSKPEKDPREIAKQKLIKSVGYPACMLCLENEGYAGRPGYPSHETLRTIPMALSGERWRLQYSPYAYYPEHCIAFNEQHIPMSISRRTFSLLFDFLDQYPHYFIGSNADLPIVGGSILNHDHFQGGRYMFPMDLAKPFQTVSHPNYPDVRVQLVRWPMTCLRLTCHQREPIEALAETLLNAWRGYSDPSHDILSSTDSEPHNTMTPIARIAEDGAYLLHLVPRNNRTSKEHPLGIFHPHSELHHIKRENIGLIEVMGLFVLPGRLRDEFEGLAAFLTGARPLVRPEAQDPLGKHFDWIASLAKVHGTSLTPQEANAALYTALTAKCVQVLEDASVFKPTKEGDAALLRFLHSTGHTSA